MTSTPGCAAATSSLPSPIREASHRAGAAPCAERGAGDGVAARLTHAPIARQRRSIDTHTQSAVPVPAKATGFAIGVRHCPIRNHRWLGKLSADNAIRVSLMQGGGVRVLIAEDDEAVRELIRINIELAGHEVVGEATNGREALDLLQAERPDVLILDMMMPNMNGREVLEELSKAEYDGTLVLAFSAAPNELEHAMELGADAAVLKTGDFDVLVDALTTL